MSEAPPQGYYAAGAPSRQPAEPLGWHLTVDACVIGGGFTGLSAALHLAKEGVPTVLLEARTVGFGASGRNGGQIHSGFRKDQAKLETWLGETHARDLWALAEDAKALIQDLAHNHAIACDLRGGLFIAAHDRRALRHLHKDAIYLSTHYGFVLDMFDAERIAFALGTNRYLGGTFDRSGGHLHPLKFAYGLAKAAEASGVVIHEDSRAVSLQEGRDSIVVTTDEGSVAAKIVILACDAYSADIAPALASYIGHVESFIVATRPLPHELMVIPSGAAVADTRHVLDYYRKSPDNRLLFAGRESYFTPPKNIARLVRPQMLRVFPALKDTPIDYAWSGTVGITRTRMPHFGRIGSRVLFGHGYSGHGVALSVIGGKVLAEAALGQEERFETLARVPARKFPGGRWLRKPLITAALASYKLLDAI